MNVREYFRDLLKRHLKQRELWDTVPQTSKLMLLAMVFCLFAAIGVISQLDSHTASQAKLWTAALFTGVFAVAYAWVAIHKTWLWIFLLLPLQAILTPLVFIMVRQHSRAGPVVPDALAPWLTTSSMLTIFLVSSAYVLTMTFIAREGDRFFRTHTEIRLAGEIHKALVADIQKQTQGFEFYGKSLASGVVGGDLVDTLEQDGHWVAYVADVAGHGVSSGVLMAMIKSATSMCVRFDPKADGLLAAVNDVLCSLKTGNMFATFACLSWSRDDGLRSSLAGHLPILLCRGEEIQWLSAQNLPLGLFPNAAFESTAVDVLPGDVLAILTDGLTEVVDKKGDELGMEAIAGTLRRLKDRPLVEIAAAILDQADRHGARSDDQSLLFVRRLQ